MNGGATVSVVGEWRGGMGGGGATVSVVGERRGGMGGDCVCSRGGRYGGRLCL